MKFTGLKNYFEPSPKKIVQIGDALLAAATTGSTFAVVANYNALGVTLMLIGVIGKFVSKMWSEDPQT